MSQKRILVTGATGKQGGALISALLAEPSANFKLLALTRNKTSSNARKLASNPNVELIEGDLDHIDAVFKQISGPLFGLFVVPILDKGEKKEAEQCRALIDAAVKAGVSRIIFTTTDRGGPVASEGNPTPVPHFASKYHIEELIKDKAAQSNGSLTYTFLRPVAFMDNFNPGGFAAAHMAMWRINGDDNKLQMVYTKDIGKIAAQAFLHADEPKYKNNSISLAGDDLTPTEVNAIFKEETGKAAPQMFWLFAYAIRYFIYDLRQMYGWFYTTGFGADISELKKEYPFLTDFRTWLRESDWTKKNA